MDVPVAVLMLAAYALDAVRAAAELILAVLRSARENDDRQ